MVVYVMLVSHWIHFGCGLILLVGYPLTANPHKLDPLITYMGTLFGVCYCASVGLLLGK